MSVYSEALHAAMLMLADHPRSVFMGQAVAFPGTSMSATFKGISPEKLVEFPVAEDMQMGLAIGAALAGDLPITVYPRWSFLLLAASQLVHHLDKLPLYSGFRPKVIIRTAIPTPKPLDPGPQHLGDFSDAFRSMLTTVKVVVLDEAKQVVPEYSRAARREGSTLLIEKTALY